MPVTTSLKEKAESILLKGIGKQDYQVINSLIAEDLIQHSPDLGEKRDGLIAYLAQLEYGTYAGKQPLAIFIKRILQDGNYVAVHSEHYLPTPASAIDLFLFKDGQVAEHWSCQSTHPEDRRGTTDGHVFVTDHEATTKNKGIIQSMIEQVFIAGANDRLDQFFHPGVIQHNPLIPGTLKGLRSVMEKIHQQGISLKVNKIHNVLGEGNFVLTLSEGVYCDQPMVFYHLFRLEDGLIMEVWDVTGEIPETFKHTNGIKDNQHSIIKHQAL